ncbi:cytochrome b/b6 domain-containing protein [Salinisphaera sp. T31B1]|uniref:cytochrome b/b6 domain-containing protein n=1 Tax=Salinisphaera sp. T31B1 TaxID=727963 RepID=UPI0033426F3C
MNTSTRPTDTPRAPAARLSSTVIKRHGWATRAWHWLNAICLLVLLMSGLQIFNAHPALYWGQTSHFDSPLLAMGAMRGPDGNPMGATRVLGHQFDTTGLFGLSEANGELAQRGFPAWATLPSSQWLALGRNWHFTAAWIFGPSLLVYLLYTVVSSRRRRMIFPSRAQWRGLPRTIWHHMRFRFDHARDYNGLQKLTYILVLFCLLPLMILTGLTMSPTMNAAWPWLLDIFGGRQSARTLHFIFAFSLVAFFIVHILLVLVSGVFNNLRSMTTGGYRLPQDANDGRPAAKGAADHD